MTTLPSPSSRAKAEKAPRAAKSDFPVKIRQTKMLINGVWQNSQSGKAFETLNYALRNYTEIKTVTVAMS